ncbi:MAG: TIGR03084 family metal-binding protein [Actinomycetota bacterium]
MRPPVAMGDLADDLALETASLLALLDGLADDEWERPTPAPGWTVADQVSHLAYFDDMAVLAARERSAFERRRDEAPPGADRITERVAQQFRGTEPAVLHAWIRRARVELDAVYRALDPSARVPWFGPDMSAAAALTARIMETWAHGTDVAVAVGRPWPVTAALRQVAHLCVRALPNSFRAHGKPDPGVPVRVELAGPDGDLWCWGPDDAVDRVTGPALDLCLVATQRAHRDDTVLVAEGPVAREWLTVAQAFAGPPGPGRAPGTRPGSSAGSSVPPT